MIVSLTSTTPDATDLGFLLHKHPDRARSVDVGFGRAHVFYPEAGAQRCTVSLLVEVDPIALARGRDRGSGRRRGPRQSAGLEPYVNDRPYVASSMMSVAIGRLFATALSGVCESRPELVDTVLDLTIEIPVVPVRGGPEVLLSLFGPLGYDVEAEPIPLDKQFPEWGDSRYLNVRLTGKHTAQRALEHLYVLLPVLDDRKHYWIGPSEVDKLLRRGGQWLADHPETEFISRRYLRFGQLTRDALARLSELGDGHDDQDAAHDKAEEAVEHPISLNEQRLTAVIEAIRAAGGGRVLDLGCGEGRLVQRLLGEASVTEIVGVDVSVGALERASRRLRLDQMSARRQERIQLLQGALTYTDSRLANFDVLTLVEVIEHVDAERLDVLADVVFANHRPATIILTTPNREYNSVFGMDEGRLRHGDHRFEWTRGEFKTWVDQITNEYDYQASIIGIGAEHQEYGQPTQMAVFNR